MWNAKQTENSLRVFVNSRLPVSEVTLRDNKQNSWSSFNINMNVTMPIQCNLNATFKKDLVFASCSFQGHIHTAKFLSVDHMAGHENVASWNIGLVAGSVNETHTSHRPKILQPVCKIYYMYSKTNNFVACLQSLKFVKFVSLKFAFCPIILHKGTKCKS